MPKEYQIIPKYLHPHVATYINDNSEFTEEVSAPELPVRSLHFITSTAGRDSVFLSFDTEPEARAEYGLPNYKLFGQPIYNMFNALNSGQARTNVMRVMPEDANYSNVVIIARYKVEDSGADKVMNIAYGAAAITGLTDPTEYLTQIEAQLTKTDVQPDGYKYIPILACRVAGKGLYGDDFRIRFAKANDENREYEWANLKLEVLKVEGALVKKETHIGSLFEDAAIRNRSFFMEDVVNDTTGSKIIKMEVLLDGVKHLYDTYKTEVDPNTKIELKNFDPIFAMDLSDRENFKAMDKLKIVTEASTPNLPTGGGELVDLVKIEGISMAGGDDGKFKAPTTKPEIQAREEAINKAYIEAMTGKTNKVVNSKASMPVDIILDAAYEEKVKKALIGLIVKRGDAYGWIDAGIVNTVADAISWAEEYKPFGNRIISKEFQHGLVRDQYTGKKIPMTTTWFLSGRLPLHFKNVGTHIPFQGEQFARVTEYVKNSITPGIDIDDLDTKEKLYTLRCNYYETIAEDVIIRSTAGTSQNIWSDLSEENNMLVTLEIKRDLERLVQSKIYNFAEAEDRQKFTEEGERLIAPRRGIQCRDVKIRFDMNPWEEERSILHCYAEVIFRTIAKRGIIEIDINKRV